MCFGLSEERDRQSFFTFLQQIGREEFAVEMSRRVSTDEISTFVDNFTKLMQKYFSENEYHRLFLNDKTRGTQREIKQH